MKATLPFRQPKPTMRQDAAVLLAAALYYARRLALGITEDTPFEDIQPRLRQIYLDQASDMLAHPERPAPPPRFYRIADCYRCGNPIKTGRDYCRTCEQIRQLEEETDGVH